MHVGLNALHLVPGETGGSELYARRLVPALLDGRPELRLTVFAAREAVDSLRVEPWAGEVAIWPIAVNARDRPRRVIAEQTLLPLAARRARVNLLHNLFSTAPALPGVPQVTTILDLIYAHHPETHQGLMARGMSLLVPLAARRSRRVITISNATRSDVCHFLGVATDRIDVTALGPGMPDDVAPMPEPQLRRELGLGDARIVLSLSAKRPHKNLERLIDAVADLSSEPSIVLVVPGYPTAFEQDLREQAARLGATGRVRFTDWLPEPALEGLFRAARCLVFPSLLEGFGLPVLEAMIRGTPVLCSKTSSLPEVAGDAALYFDPTDTGAIREALERILADEGPLRERLAAAGRHRARRFTWGATARATVASYERALEG